MLAQTTTSGRFIRHAASMCLLVLLGLLLVAPAAVALTPRGCGCSCPRNSPSCCCRRDAHAADPGGPYWTTASCCQGHCPRTVAAPVTFPAFPLPLGPLRVAPTADPRSLPGSELDGNRHSCYLSVAFLYQRPPPLPAGGAQTA